MLFNLHLTLTIKYDCDNLKVVPHLENDTINYRRYDIYMCLESKIFGSISEYS